MKPYPLLLLNHFTFPLATSRHLPSINLIRCLRRKDSGKKNAAAIRTPNPLRRPSLSSDQPLPQTSSPCNMAPLDLSRLARVSHARPRTPVDGRSPARTG